MLTMEVHGRHTPIIPAYAKYRSSEAFGSAALPRSLRELHTYIVGTTTASLCALCKSGPEDRYT